VLLGAGSAAPAGVQFLVNLAAAPPADPGETARILEIVDADEERRRAGRIRFRQYRERGCEPKTRNVSKGELSQPA
jgi:DNA polymerase-3 subunit chi